LLLDWIDFQNTISRFCAAAIVADKPKTKTPIPTILDNFRIRLLHTIPAKHDTGAIPPELSSDFGHGVNVSPTLPYAKKSADTTRAPAEFVS
jgi:hypothetical protein